MFFKLGGTLMFLGTENDKPIASPSLMYGSCPTITTFKLSNEVCLNALNIKFLGGNTV